MEWILWVLLYFGLWALAVVWSIATSRLIRKDVKYERDRKFEKIRDGGVAILAFAAGGGAAVGLFAIGLEADLGVLIYLILAFGVGAVAASSVFIGESFKKAGGVTTADVTDIKRPDWLLADNDVEKQNELVARNNNPKKMLQAVVYSPYQSVRENALAKIKNENTLVDVICAVGQNSIGRNETDEMIMERAAEKITALSILHKIAKLPSYTYIKIEPRKMYELVVNKIMDEDILWDIINSSGNYYARKAATAKISDPDRIISLAKGYSDSVIRSAAVVRVSDNAVLADIAKHGFIGFNNDYRILAAKRLTDKEYMRDVAQNAQDYRVRATAKSMLEQLSNLDPKNLAAQVRKFNKDTIVPRAYQAPIKVGNSFRKITYNKKSVISGKDSKKTDYDQLYSVVCPECGEIGYSDSYRMSGSDGYESIVSFKCMKCRFAVLFDFRNDGPDRRWNSNA